MVQHVDPAEKRIILTEAFELQLARFSPLTYDEWNKDDKRRKYILRLFEISECADERLTQKAVELFPHELHLWQSPSNSFHTTLLCEVLRKQDKVIKRLDLEACFSTPGDIKKIISAITEMPGKVQILDISRNTLQTIPPSSFFMKIDQYLRMFHCFPHEDKRTGRNRNANDTERHEIQNILDQFDNSHLEVDVGGDVRLSSRNKSDLT
ncbi:unnamed protein product [Clavelina lepadiformis]|uniref:Uncharacterized protein n=1 Tax=Clavelina lepadiformis TaxID=159417 RepID=A0ABP0GKB0_CLALP